MRPWKVQEKLLYIWPRGKTSLGIISVLLKINTIFLFRYARVDAAKLLIDAQADVNVRDVNGRTPLHAAIAADAQGVFQVKKRSIMNNRIFK